MKSGEGASNKEVEGATEPAVQGDQQSISATAPAWTPGGVATDATSPVALPRDDKVEDTSAASETAAPEKGGDVVRDSSSVTASDTASPAKKGGDEIGDSSIVPAVEPKVPADELSP